MKKISSRAICKTAGIICTAIAAGGTVAAIAEHYKNKRDGRKYDSLYQDCIKRGLDFSCAAAALIFCSPLYLGLTITGAIAMKGNPFFVQERPGMKDVNGQEQIFKLYKFRTMTNEKDAEGELLPDEDRLNKYGDFIRTTSLDELPQAYNIIKNEMSVIGPRPLLVEYIPRYTEYQRHRHDVKPGLSGLSQVNGRNRITWDDKFGMDVWYSENVSFINDIKILLTTVGKFVKREDIHSSTSATMEEFMG